MSKQSTETEPWYGEGLRFTCTQCGNCCTGPSGYVWFNDHEAKALAEHFGLTVGAFRRKYAHKVDGKWSLQEVDRNGEFDCVFLERDEQGRGLCSVYDLRPRQCRTWPFWPENLRSFRSYVNAARTCPGMTSGLEGKGSFYPVEKIRVIRDATTD